MMGRNLQEKDGGGLINLARLIQTSPYIFVWALFNSRKNPAQKIRYYYAKLFWRELPHYGVLNFILILLLFLLWPLGFLAGIYKLGFSPYKSVKHKTGKYFITQIWEQFFLAICYSLTAKEYFMYGFYEKEKRKLISKYLLRLTFKPLIYSFLDRVYMKKNNLTTINHQDSKEFFDRVCKEHNLQAVSIIAKIKNGKVTYLLPKEEIAKHEALFIKPEELRGGSGAQLWVREGNKFTNSKGEKLMLSELMETLRIKSKGQELLVQPKITNHPDLFFQTKALNTIRICTMLIDNKIVIPFGVFRFSGNKKAIVDNFHAGGYVAPIVDLDKGILGAAIEMGLKSPGNWITEHPINHAKIKDLFLPFWAETKELIKRAHRVAFSSRILLGWDVAITKNGPVLIECNGWPDNELIQTGYNRPMSELAGMNSYAQKIREEYKWFYKN